MGPCISVDITVDDLIAYNLHWLSNSDPIKKQIRSVRLVALVALFPIAILALVAAIGRMTGEFIVFVALGTGFVGWLLVLPRYTAWALPRRLRVMVAKGLTPGPRPSRLWVDDSGGIVDESEDRTTWYSPTAIERIVETPDHAFVIVGPGQALIIPRRNGTQPVEAFVQALKWHRAQRDRFSTGRH